MCIDIVEIWFWVASGQILTETRTYFRFRTITCVNVKEFKPNLVHALILRSGLGIAKGQISLSARDTIMAEYYSLTLCSKIRKIMYSSVNPNFTI